MVELELEIHSSSIETHLSKLYRNFIETLSKRIDLVEIRMEILSSSDCSQRFVSFFGLIDLAVESSKIDPIHFFFLVLLSTR